MVVTKKELCDLEMVVTKKELWMQQAPSWNFDLGEDALLKKALERGFVTKVSEDQYLINEDY